MNIPPPLCHMSRLPYMACYCVSLCLAGDTGEGEEPTEGELIKESDNTFMIWASGRQNCIGMAVQLDVSVDVHTGYLEWDQY